MKRGTVGLASLILPALCAMALLVVLPMSAYAGSVERGPAPQASLQDASQATPQAWESAYKEVLDSSKTPIGAAVNPSMKQFSLVDIDGDGTPELITLGDEFMYDHMIYRGNQAFSFQGEFKGGDVYLLSSGSKLTLFDNGILELHQEGTVPLWNYFRIGQGPSLEQLFGYGWRGSPDYDVAWFVTTEPGQPIVGRAAVEARLAEIVGGANPLKIPYVENSDANRALLDNPAQGAFRAYSDVADAMWYSGAVQAVATANLMRGYGGSDAFGVGGRLRVPSLQ